MENFKGFELTSPIHKDKKWTFSGSIGKIDSIKERFVKRLSEPLWIEAENYFNEYYAQLLLLAEDKMKKILTEYRELIFQNYILSIQSDLGLVNSLFTDLKQSAHTFLWMRINNFFMFTDLLFAGMMKDPNMLLTEIKDAKLNHLNYITQGRNDYKLFLSAYFEFYLPFKKQKNNTVNYRHDDALHNAADKYKIEDTKGGHWESKFTTIKRNYENWVKLNKNNPNILIYVEKYNEDKDLIVVT